MAVTQSGAAKLQFPERRTLKSQTSLTACVHLKITDHGRMDHPCYHYEILSIVNAHEHSSKLIRLSSLLSKKKAVF